MWEHTGVIIALLAVVIAFLGNVVAVTVFVVKLGGKIDVNNTAVLGELKVVNTRVESVEAKITDLKNTDRRLSVVEDRQTTLATRQGNVEQDNLLIREDLGKLHDGLDRHVTALDRFNEAQLSGKGG